MKNGLSGAGIVGRNTKKDLIVMKSKVYIETSVISYLTSRISRDLITAGHQQITQEWWGFRRKDFDLYVSQLVIKESGRGDNDASEKRLSVLKDIPLLQLNDEITDLAEEIIFEKIIPEKYAEDSIHIAIATIHKIDYLLTWNCRHIANAELRKNILKLCTRSGYNMPIICTPEELMGEIICGEIQ